MKTSSRQIKHFVFGEDRSYCAKFSSYMRRCYEDQRIAGTSAIRSDTVLITKLLFSLIIHESKGKESSGEGKRTTKGVRKDHPPGSLYGEWLRAAMVTNGDDWS